MGRLAEDLLGLIKVFEFSTYPWNNLYYFVVFWRYLSIDDGLGPDFVSLVRSTRV